MWDAIVSRLPAEGFPNLVAMRAGIGAVVERFKPGGVHHEELLTALKAWPERLRRCVAAEGGHFEV